MLLVVAQGITHLKQHSHANNVVHYVEIALEVHKTIALVALQVLYFKMECVNKTAQQYTMLTFT